MVKKENEKSLQDSSTSVKPVSEQCRGGRSIPTGSQTYVLTRQHFKPTSFEGVGGDVLYLRA